MHFTHDCVNVKGGVVPESLRVTSAVFFLVPSTPAVAIATFVAVGSNKSPRSPRHLPPVLPAEHVIVSGARSCVAGSLPGTASTIIPSATRKGSTSCRRAFLGSTEGPGGFMMGVPSRK